MARCRLIEGNMPAAQRDRMRQGTRHRYVTAHKVVQPIRRGMATQPSTIQEDRMNLHAAPHHNSKPTATRRNTSIHRHRHRHRHRCHHRLTHACQDRWCSHSLSAATSCTPLATQQVSSAVSITGLSAARAGAVQTRLYL